MTTFRTLSASLLLLLATAIAVPTAAFHDDATPLIAADNIAGPGWARYDFTTDGAKVVVDLTVQLASVPAVGSLLVTSPGFGAFMISLLATDSGPEVHAHSDELPAAFSVDLSPDQSNGWFGVGITMENWAGDLTAVAYGAGGVASIDASLRGADGVTLTSNATGTRTFLYTADDFRGTINAGASVSLLKPGVVIGDVTQPVEGTLIGQYFAIGETNLVGVTTQQTSISRPSGSDTCFCWWMDPDAAADPGDWTFHLTYASTTFISNVFLFAADLSG